MSLRRVYKTDSAKETGGIPVHMAPNDDGSIPTFYVARSSRANPKYLAALERILKPHRPAIARNALPVGMSEKLMRQVFIEGALIGWDNVLSSDVNGNPDSEGFAQFNETNAETLFDGLPELFAELESKASDMSNFKAEQLEADSGN